jgi:hypothetical protein
MAHKVYTAIVNAVRSGKLKEPFSSGDFQAACPGFKSNTYKAFLSKHAVGNPSKTSELFVRVVRGRYKCVRPFKYGM